MYKVGDKVWFIKSIEEVYIGNQVGLHFKVNSPSSKEDNSIDKNQRQ